MNEIETILQIPLCFTMWIGKKMEFRYVFEIYNEYLQVTEKSFYAAHRII